jgi:hypothetical protein
MSPTAATSVLLSHERMTGTVAPEALPIGYCRV